MLEQAVASPNPVEEDAEATMDRTTKAAFDYFFKRDNMHKQVDAAPINDFFKRHSIRKQATTGPNQIQGIRRTLSSRKDFLALNFSQRKIYFHFYFNA